MTRLVSKIAKQIRAGRMNCTQQEAAKSLGISQAVLSKIEQGKREPTGAELFRFARLYRRPIGFFFPEAGTKRGIVSIIEVTEDLLQRITRQIVTTFAPRRVILFGSHAWGKPTATSDVDLFVETETLQALKPAMRRYLVKTVCQPHCLPMDILVKSPKEVEERLAMGDGFLRQILDHGRVLYAQSAG